jgi:hypothetical protein
MFEGRFVNLKLNKVDVLELENTIENTNVYILEHDDFDLSSWHGMTLLIFVLLPHFISVLRVLCSSPLVFLVILK